MEPSKIFFSSDLCVYELLLVSDLVSILVEVNKALCISFYYGIENYGKLSRGSPERTIIELLIDDTGVRKEELSWVMDGRSVRKKIGQMFPFEYDQIDKEILGESYRQIDMKRMVYRWTE